MDKNTFELVKDFYTLKKEYEVNMVQLRQRLQRLDRDVDRLTRSFNELKDAVGEPGDR